MHLVNLRKQIVLQKQQKVTNDTKGCYRNIDKKVTQKRLIIDQDLRYHFQVVITGISLSCGRTWLKCWAHLIFLSPTT